MLVIFILTSPIAVYSNYWLYQNKTNPISISIKEDVDENIFQTMSSDSILVHNTSKGLDPISIQQPNYSDVENVVKASDELDYSGQSLENISSPEDIRRIREESSEPLYLRGYLIVPSVGIKERIMEGLGESALTYGVGTMNPSSHPSQYGTYALAGHNFGDWDYGTGLSKLQKYGSSLVGELAYITYGDMVYEYKIVDVKQMFRDYSMPYTEVDWNSRNLSGLVPQYTSDYQVIPGTQALRPNDFYASYDLNPNMNYNYGKILTLYTCHVLPPDYRFSYDRIIARGIQVNSYNIDNVPQHIKNHLIANSGTDQSKDFNLLDNLSISAQAQSDKTFTATKLENINSNESKEDIKNINDDNFLIQFINKQLEKNPKFMERVALISTVIATLSLMLFIIIPRR